MSNYLTDPHDVRVLVAGLRMLREIYRQPAFRDFPSAAPALPVAERFAAEVVSLPMHGYLDPAVQDRIIDGVRGFVSERRPARRGSGASSRSVDGQRTARTPAP